MSNLSNLASQTAETIMRPECVDAKIFTCLQVKRSVDLNLTKFDKIKRTFDKFEPLKEMNPISITLHLFEKRFRRSSSSV